MNATEFTAVVEREQWPLFRVCYAILPLFEDAEDATVETWLKVWRAVDRAPADVVEQHKWLVAIARNVCLDHLRRARIRPQSAPEDARIASADSTEDAALLHCEIAETFALMERMPRLDRGALIATALGYNGEQLRIRRGTLKSRTWRARERLRAGLAA